MPAPNQPGKGVNTGAAGTYWKVQTIKDPATFCSSVVSDEKDLQTWPISKVMLKPFQLGNSTPGIERDNTGNGGQGWGAVGFENEGNVFEITGYDDPSQLTCCGNRLKNDMEKFLDWVAQVGGVAGILHSIFLLISSLDLGAKCSKSKEDQDDDDDGIEFHVKI
eukprot:g2912.t1